MSGSPGGADERPEASVVISTRNRAAWLDESLRTVCEQRTRRWFEVVVVDNGSTDGTADLLERWRAQDRRIVPVSEPRVGLSVGKNAGARAARAPLLVFTDDDVLVDPGWLEAYCSLFRQPHRGPVVAGGPVVPVPADLSPWPEWVSDRHLDDMTRLQHGSRRVLPPGRYVWGANMAIRADDFALLGGWDESLGRRGDERGTFEDTDLQDRVRARGGEVLYVPEAEIRHRTPAEVAEPGRILAVGFQQARNGYWRDKREGGGGDDAQPRWGPAGTVAALVAVVGCWAGWLLLAGAFRLTRSRRMLDAAHRCVHRCGRCLERFRDGTRSRGVGARLCALTLRIRDRSEQLLVVRRAG